MLIGIRKRRSRSPPTSMASHYLDILKSRLWRTNFGRPGGVPMGQPRKIGSMPRNNCDPGRRPDALALEDDSCPKCGTEMEPIDIAVEDLPARQLRLCPACY